MCEILPFVFVFYIRNLVYFLIYLFFYMPSFLLFDFYLFLCFVIFFYFSLLLLLLLFVACWCRFFPYNKLFLQQRRKMWFIGIWLEIVKSSVSIVPTHIIFRVLLFKFKVNHIWLFALFLFNLKTFFEFL